MKEDGVMETNIADNIRTFRKQRGLTQEQLAEILGVSIGAVYKWESKSCLPELRLIMEMADFFDVSERERCMQEYQNALLERQGYYVQEIKKDPQFNHLNESEIIETANELTLYENDVLIE
jgi:transcriptional regulator with XRE-family HTH domain